MGKHAAHHTFWISGGSGTLGSALTLHLLSQGHKVRAFARSDHRLSELEAKVPQAQRERLSCQPGNVENPSRVARSMAGCDYVIHAAAMKRIDTCEYSPAEAVGTNIEGTRSVIDAVLLEPRVKKALFISTDKARAPSTLYGATKLAAERLWLAGNHYTPNDPKFLACAYGNVWGSKGSVLEQWAKQAVEGAIQITDPKSTRFHITLADAVAFILKALDYGRPGTLLIPRLPAYCLEDLATAFNACFNLKRKPVTIGRRPAEKLHEELVSENESHSCAQEDSEMFVLEPGKVYGEGGWSFKSCSQNTKRLGVGGLAFQITELSKQGAIYVA